MDSYNAQLRSMQQYVPFLDKMITKLEKARDEKDPELAKMRSLHGILTDGTKKVRMETLLKCQDVIQKLYEKVEGVPISCIRQLGVVPDTPASPDQSSPTDNFSDKLGDSRSRPPRSPSPEQSDGSISSYLMNVHDKQHRIPRQTRETKHNRSQGATKKYHIQHSRHQQNPHQNQHDEGSNERSLSSYLMSMHDAQHNSRSSMQSNLDGKPASSRSSNSTSFISMPDVDHDSQLNSKSNSSRRRGLLGEAPDAEELSEGISNLHQEPRDMQRGVNNLHQEPRDMQRGINNPWRNQTMDNNEWQGQGLYGKESLAGGNNQLRGTNEQEQCTSFSDVGGKFTSFNSQGRQFRGLGGNCRASRDQDQPRGPNFRDQANQYGGIQRQWADLMNKRSVEDPWGEVSGQFWGLNEQESQFRGPKEMRGQFRDSNEQSDTFRNQEIGNNFREQEDTFDDQRQWNNQVMRNNQGQWSNERIQTSLKCWKNQTSQSFTDLQTDKASRENRGSFERMSRVNRGSFERDNRSNGDERTTRGSLECDNGLFQENEDHRGVIPSRDNEGENRGLFDKMNTFCGETLSNSRGSFERDRTDRTSSQGHQRLSSQERKSFEGHYLNPSGKNSASLERDRARKSLESRKSFPGKVPSNWSQGNCHSDILPHENLQLNIPLSPNMTSCDTPLSPKHSNDTPVSPHMHPGDTPLSPPVYALDTPLSPPMNTPKSPTSPDSTPSWWDRRTDKEVIAPKVIPLEPKAIPLEREGSTPVSFLADDLKYDIAPSNPQKPQETIQRSQEERKNRLLKIKSKLENKERKGKEFSPNLLVSSSQDSNKPTIGSIAKTTVEPIKSRAVSSTWTPLLITPDSPPSLKIADTPTSPDTPASPDTQTVSPDTRGSPASPSLEIPSTPASPDTNLASSNTPDSPEFISLSEPSISDIKEIPTIPLALGAPDSSGCMETIHDSEGTFEHLLKTEISSRKRDPRARKDAAKTSRDPRFREKESLRSLVPSPQLETQPTLSSSSNQPTQPAYMTNLVPSHPPPRVAGWTTNAGPPIIPPPHALPHRLSIMNPSYQVPPPTIPGNRYPQSACQHVRHQQPPSNYREYRKLKEEAERKQRDADKKFNEETKRKQELEGKDQVRNNTEQISKKELLKVTVNNIEESKKEPHKVVEPIHSYSSSKDIQERKMDDSKLKKFKIPKVVKSESAPSIVEKGKELKARDKIQKQFKEAEVKKEETITVKVPVHATSTVGKALKKVEKFVTKTDVKNKNKSFVSRKSSGSKFFFPDEDSSEDEDIKVTNINPKSKKKNIDKKIRTKDLMSSSEEDEDKKKVIPIKKVRQQTRDQKVKSKFNRLRDSSEEDKELAITKKKVRENINRKCKEDEDTSDEEIEKAEVIPKKKIRKSIRDVKVKVEVNEPVDTVTDSATVASLRKTPEPPQHTDLTLEIVEDNFDSQKLKNISTTDLDVIDSTVEEPIDSTARDLADTDSEVELTIAEDTRQSTDIKVELTEVEGHLSQDIKSTESKEQLIEIESKLMSNDIKSIESTKNMTDVEVKVRGIEAKTIEIMTSIVESKVTETVKKSIETRRQSLEIKVEKEPFSPKGTVIECGASIDDHRKVKEIDTKEEVQSLKPNFDETVCQSELLKDLVPTKKYITKEEKDDLTKELLKNIVSSLEPDEAKKLLEKASLLDKVEKVSLKELKLLLVASDQESSEVEEDVKNKELTTNNKSGKGRGKPKYKFTKKSSIKVKPEPKVGTRRSRRLQLPEPVDKEYQSPSEKADVSFEKEESIESEKDIVHDVLGEGFQEEENKEESEFETFVIEPKTVSRKGRQKKGKGKRGRKAEHQEDVQDDCVSSSTNKEDAMDEVKVEPSTELKKEPVEETMTHKSVIKEESEEQVELSVNRDEVKKKAEKELNIKIEQEVKCEEEMSRPTSPSLAPVMRTTRSRMAPKNKTWCPIPADKNKVTKALLKMDKTKYVSIKKEDASADVKVFLGEGEVSKEDFLLNTFDYNVGEFDKERFIEKKERREKLRKIVQKLETIEVKCDTIEKKKEGTDEMPLKLCSKIKLGRPSEIRPFTPPALVPNLELSAPIKYNSRINETISKLADQLKLVQSQQIHLDQHNQCVNFLDLVRDIKRRNQRKKQPPPPLIPLFGPQTDSESNIMLSLKEEEKLSFICGPMTPCPGLSSKTSEVYLEMLSFPKIQHMFKCMCSNCAFTTNRPVEFRHHLCSHGCKDKNATLCSYCGSRFRGAKGLLGHILSTHGENNIQCPHCFYRARDKIKVLIHQTAFHKSLSRGFLVCKALPSSVPFIQFEMKDVAPLKCLHENCNFQTEALNVTKWQHHEKDHRSSRREFQCGYCSYVTTCQIKLVIHEFLQHPRRPLKVFNRHIDHVHSDTEEEEESSLESDDNEVNGESDEDSSDGINDLLEYDYVESKTEEMAEEKGFSGFSLYRCGNSDCDFSSQSVSLFRDHQLVCEFSEIQFKCFHCGKQFKYLPSLLDHLKTHGVKRFSCGLCNFKCSLHTSVKNHLKVRHRVSQVKMVPVNKCRTNQEEDPFVVVPKNAVFKQQRSKHVKDTFAPEEVESIPPKPDIYRYFIRCSVCEFTTKVRLNLVKHLKLHLRSMDTPDMTPVNPSPIVDEGFESNYSRMRTTNNMRMKSNLPSEIEEADFHAPLSDSMMSLIPAFVPENLRFACSGDSCRYMTIDSSMLAYHIKALHPDLELYSCPHCQDVHIPIHDMPPHLQCHGDQLFKCIHCMYYHPQKRTTEKHVSDVHKGKILFVKDVRAEADIKDRLKHAAMRKKKEIKIDIKPYKCGLCDVTDKNVNGIRKHCEEVHEIEKQFKCGLCDKASNVKVDVENHFSTIHKDLVFSILKVYYVDPTTSVELANQLVNEEKRFPLWSRGMEKLKHIRGILFDENILESGSEKVKREATAKKSKKLEQDTLDTEQDSLEQQQIIDPNCFLKKKKGIGNKLSKVSKAALDFYPMKCKQCNVSKKTVTGLKMHIKLIHMHLGKFQCKHCNFTANIKGSIQGHYKNRHPDSNKDSEDQFDFNERNSEAQTYSQEYWKMNWDIPTLSERSSFLQNSVEQNHECVEKDQQGESAKRKDLDVDVKVSLQVPPNKKRKVGQKRGRKRKTTSKKDDLPVRLDEIESTDKKLKRDDSDNAEIKPLEMSPFESCRSYKCAYCPKRSQNLDTINRHHEEMHVNYPFEYIDLSRDQVVNMITNDQTHAGNTSEYKCFYCQELGDIIKLKTHTQSLHLGQVLKVTKLHNSKVPGYLECQICGYLSSGFDKSKQKVHFHEEHPMEGDVNCSKYTSKVKLGPDAFTSPNQTFKFDVREVEGRTFWCPRGSVDDTGEDNCTFTTKTLSQINSHLRKHTRTYKCGHCGKTLPDSSEFHRHSALSHGDKIPDLVKDPEAEAEYEGLKGLLEWTIQKELADRKELAEQATSSSSQASKIVARKSTGPASRSAPGDKCRNVARKSTGPAAKFWPETRIEIPYSFYGINMDKIDPRTVKTRMTMGGMEITFDAEKMGQLINLDPRLVLKDCAKETIRLDQI